MHLYSIAFLFLLLLEGVRSACTNITVGDKRYDLSSLANITVSSDGNYKFALCEPTIRCIYNNYSVYTQITASSSISSTSCMPLTNLGSLQPSYEQVSNGLLMTYLPVGAPIFTSPMMTSVNIVCAPATKPPVQANSSMNSYRFDIESPAGCSYYANNNFWDFMYDRAIIFAIVLWAIGLFELLFAYYFLQITIFLYGFITAGAFGLIYLAQNYPDGTVVLPTSTYNFMILLSAVLGIFYGFFLITQPRIGYFNVGVWLGAILSLMLQNAILYLSKSMIPFYITLGVICLLCGLSALMAFRYFIIVATSIVSGYMLIRPLGFYLDYYPNEFQFYKTPDGKMPWQYYLYLIAMLVMAGVGVAFQSWLMKQNRHRSKGVYDLEGEGDIKERFKKLLQFKEIKDMFNKSKDELKFIKKMISHKDEPGDDTPEGGRNSISLRESLRDSFLGNNQESDHSPEKKNSSKAMRSEPQTKKRPSNSEDQEQGEDSRSKKKGTKKQQQQLDSEENIEIQMTEYPKKKVVRKYDKK